MSNALSPTMTVRAFENGYWYLDQLKNFAERLGIPAARKLRKDELERAIVAFLRTGKAVLPTRRSLRKTGVKDVERGLDLKLRIQNYTSNRETKDAHRGRYQASRDRVSRDTFSFRNDGTAAVPISAPLVVDPGVGRSIDERRLHGSHALVGADRHGHARSRRTG